MAITQEDIDRIKKALESGSYAQDSDIAQLQQLGLVIRSQADQQTFESNLRTQVRDEVVGAEDLPAYRNIEKRLEEITGEKRQDGEKASEFLARIVSPMKTQLEERQAEIDSLKAGKGDDQRVLTLQAELDKQKKAYEKQVAEASRQLTDYKLNTEYSQFDQLASGLELSVDDKFKSDVLSNRLRKFRDEVEVRFNDKGETVYWNKKEDRQILNPTTLANPSREELLAGYFADVKAEPGATGGTGGSDKGDRSKPTAYTQARHRGELMEMLSKDGLTTDSDDFNTKYIEAMTAYETANGKPMPIFGE